MSVCQFCRAEIPEEADRCQDAKACSARIGRRLNPEVKTMATKPFIDFDPVKAYKESEKGVGPRKSEAA